MPNQTIKIDNNKWLNEKIAIQINSILNQEQYLWNNVEWQSTNFINWLWKINIKWNWIKFDYVNSAWVKSLVKQFTNCYYWINEFQLDDQTVTW